MTGEPEQVQPSPGPALGHLIVLRTTLAAALTNLDAAINLLSGVDPGQSVPCQHPEDQLVPISGLGEKLRVRCRVCGAELEKESTW